MTTATTEIVTLVTQVTRGAVATRSVTKKTTTAINMTEGISETTREMAEAIDLVVETVGRVITETDPLIMIVMETQRETEVPTSDKRSKEVVTTTGKRNQRVVSDESTVTVTIGTVVPGLTSAQGPNKASTVISVVALVAATATEIAEAGTVTEVAVVATVTEVAVVAIVTEVAVAATVTGVAVEATVTGVAVAATQLLVEPQGRWSSQRAHTMFRSLQICIK